ncbi:hypothetical protein HanPSC8_Chr10g0436801 [Helianthus annuus]|nr:hypothetical protein HanPSC8_Chr10g0436801 [Helianthus annuus]
MDAIEELNQLADSMRQAVARVNDEDVEAMMKYYQCLYLNIFYLYCVSSRFSLIQVSLNRYSYEDLMNLELEFLKTL